jgi:hypothetical protein
MCAMGRRVAVGTVHRSPSSQSNICNLQTHASMASTLTADDLSPRCNVPQVAPCVRQTELLPRRRNKVEPSATAAVLGLNVPAVCLGNVLYGVTHQQCRIRTPPSAHADGQGKDMLGCSYSRRRPPCHARDIYRTYITFDVAARYR